MKDITKYLKNREVTKINYLKITTPIIFIMLLFFAIAMMNKIESNESNINNLTDTFKPIYISLLVILIAIAIINMRETYHYSGIESEFNIYSLNGRLETKGELHGGFILGIGTISGSSEQIDYFVYFKEGKFGLIKDKIEQSEVEVVQTNKIKPSIKEVWVDNELHKILFVPINTIKRKISIGG